MNGAHEMKIYSEIIELSQGGGVKVNRATNCIEQEHRHEFIEIEYLIEGHMTHKIDDNYYEIFPGDMIFINYESVHSFVADGKVDYVNFLFKPEFMNKALVNKENIFEVFKFFMCDEFETENKKASSKFYPVIHFDETDRKEVEHIAFRMIDEYRNQKIGYRTFLKNYMCLIFSMMIRNMQSMSEHDKIASGVLKYIDTNYFSDLLLADLAKRESYSPAYFSRKFKEMYGIGVREYIQRCRIEAAANMLINTDISIDNIAERVGYNDTSQFHKQFKKYTGMTPGNVRKEGVEVQVKKLQKNIDE